MRNYVVKNKNKNPLPHNLYMQMLYVIRSFREEEQELEETAAQKKQRSAVRETKKFLETSYKKSSGESGAFDSIQAFFEYPYYSLRFMQKGRELGASKRSWNLYRCRFAYLVAEKLGLIVAASDSRPDG